MIETLLTPPLSHLFELLSFYLVSIDILGIKHLQKAQRQIKTLIKRRLVLKKNNTSNQSVQSKWLMTIWLLLLTFIIVFILIKGFLFWIEFSSAQKENYDSIIAIIAYDIFTGIYILISLFLIFTIPFLTTAYSLFFLSPIILLYVILIFSINLINKITLRGFLMFAGFLIFTLIKIFQYWYTV